MLLYKKMLVTFLAVFFPVVLLALVDALDAIAKGDPDYNNIGRAFLLAGVVAGCAAGGRAVIAVLPWNIVPSDALHTPGKHDARAAVSFKDGGGYPIEGNRRTPAV